MAFGFEQLRRRAVRRILLALARRNFRRHGCDFEVPPGVLNPTIFRASFAFAEAAVAAAPRAPCDVLELGCGAGLAAVLLARAGHRVTATDIDVGAVAATQANADRNGVVVEVVGCDWDTALDAGRRFDLVVVNPPFLPIGPQQVEQLELARALVGGRDLAAVAAALAAVARRLRVDGRALMLTSERSGRQVVLAHVERSGLVAAECRIFSSWGERYHLELLRSR